MASGLWFGEGERMNLASGKISPQKGIPLFTFAFNLHLI
jgi:hypothetical protein